MVEREATIKKDFTTRTTVWARILQALGGDADKVLAQYGAPNQVDFRYPVSKRKTKENVAEMQSAEARLDTFWRKVDEIMHHKAGDLRGTAIKNLLMERVLTRTPDWIEPQEKDIVEVKGLIRPLSELYLDLERRTKRTVDRQQRLTSVKVKERTRKEAVTEIPQNDIEAEPKNQIKPPTFKLDRRAYKVFRTLFFTQSHDATPGEVPWSDFLHAMVSTGFQPTKLYGSVWQFNPGDAGPGRGRSIQFHEPHPVKKIPYFVARRHGRRLTRAYGWHCDMFELAS